MNMLLGLCTLSFLLGVFITNKINSITINKYKKSLTGAIGFCDDYRKIGKGLENLKQVDAIIETYKVNGKYVNDFEV